MSFNEIGILVVDKLTVLRETGVNIITQGMIRLLNIGSEGNGKKKKLNRSS